MGYREFSYRRASDMALDYTRLENPEEAYNFGLALLVEVNDHRLAVAIQDKFGQRNRPASPDAVDKVADEIGYRFDDAREIAIEVFIDAGLDDAARFIEYQN
jgi:hypothetical protein